MATRKGNWIKGPLTLESGEVVEAQHPEIISASRSTDIPAFYCDWFFHRLKKGYSVWTNPFNGVRSYVAYDQTRFIVFWSKNPQPLLQYLPLLKKRDIACYVQYSLNDYEAEGLEKAVPSLTQRIETFKELVLQLGKGGVIWRFDPLILTDDIDIDILLNRIENIGDQLNGFTEKLVFSFADIAIYKRVKKNLDDAHVPYHEWSKEQMLDFAARLVTLNKRKGWNYELATCGEAVNLDGVSHNHCIDDALMIKRAFHDKALMEFLKVKFQPMPQPDMFGKVDAIPKDAIILGNGTYATRGNNKDKGQRKEFCGCMKAKDIGQYNTCIHQCEYCYANDNKAAAQQNFEMHRQNSKSETITGT